MHYLGRRPQLPADRSCWNDEAIIPNTKSDVNEVTAVLQQKALFYSMLVWDLHTS